MYLWIHHKYSSTRPKPCEWQRKILQDYQFQFAIGAVVALDFVKVVRLVFWSGVVGPGFALTVALRAQKLDLWASLWSHDPVIWSLTFFAGGSLGWRFKSRPGLLPVFFLFHRIFTLWLVPAHYHCLASRDFCDNVFLVKGMFTWKEEDLIKSKILEGGKTFRPAYIQ